MTRFVAPPPQGPVEPGPPPSFSVLVRMYQAADTVGGAIASLLAQTRRPDEIVVCDDGSTDDVDGALAPFRAHIKVLRKENGGAASALNAAASAAAGEFVAILDADDVYEPERLEVLAELAAARPDLDLLVTDAYFVVDGQRVGRFYESNSFDVTDQRKAILRSCFIGGWPAVRRRRLLALGGFDEALAIGHDWECWIRLLLDGAKAGLVDEPLLEYRLRGDSLTASRVQSLEDRVRVLQKTASHPRLNTAERRVLTESLRTHARRAVRARAAADLRAASGTSEPILLSIARNRELPMALRAKAATSYLSGALRGLFAANQ
jgi:glycosyltransferase involved in cell wall biosynthesis